MSAGIADSLAGLAGAEALADVLPREPGADLSAHSERSKIVKFDRIPEAGPVHRNVDPSDAINSKTPHQKLVGSITPPDLRWRSPGLRSCGLSAFALIAAICMLGAQAMAADGLVTIKSALGPEETMKRLEAEVKAKGLTVFAHVDHAAGAAAVNLPLRPTEVLIFGNARGGTPLMQAAQTTGIDLPLKALVWQDAQGKTWLSYNEPAFIAQRHGVDAHRVPAVAAIAELLDAVTKAATSE
jgi:uncharacterized protein (DUF302 family)